jgi:hypothetical protein
VESLIYSGTQAGDTRAQRAGEVLQLFLGRKEPHIPDAHKSKYFGASS